MNDNETSTVITPEMQEQIRLQAIEIAKQKGEIVPMPPAVTEKLHEMFNNVRDAWKAFETARDGFNSFVEGVKHHLQIPTDEPYDIDPDGKFFFKVHHNMLKVPTGE